MKKIYHHTLFLVIFLNCFAANSAQVSESTAKTVAINFMKTVDSRVNSSSLEVVYTRESAFYVFGHANGFIIIAADDRVTPIFGYSTESVFVVPENKNNSVIKSLNSLCQFTFQKIFGHDRKFAQNIFLRYNAMYFAQLNLKNGIYRHRQRVHS
jgi:hypothetical protein